MLSLRLASYVTVIMGKHPDVAVHLYYDTATGGIQAYLVSRLTDAEDIGDADKEHNGTACTCVLLLGYFYTTGCGRRGGSCITFAKSMRSEGTFIPILPGGGVCVRWLCVGSGALRQGVLFSMECNLDELVTPDILAALCVHG